MEVLKLFWLFVFCYYSSVLSFVHEGYPNRYNPFYTDTTTTMTTTAATTTQPPFYIHGASIARLVADPSSKCPSGYGQYATTCLKMSKDFAGYSTAESKCQADGAKLASPKNQQIYSYMKQLAEASRTGSYWVGLKKVNDKWVFGDNTSIGAFNQWAPGQPMQGEENECAVMAMRFNHSWLSTGCKWAWRYICQFDLEKGTQPEMPTISCNAMDLKQYFLHPSMPHTTDFYVVGTAIPVECDVGYGVKKPFLVECGSGAKWDIVKPCLPICPYRGLTSPLMYLNSTLPRNFLAGDTISFTCPKDHMVIGEQHSHCLKNRSWSTPLPQCILRKKDLERTETSQSQCNNVSSVTKVPDPFVNSMPDIEFLKEGQSVLLSCMQHFTIEPRSIRTSAKEWTWMKDQTIISDTDPISPNLKVDETGSLMILQMTPQLEGLYTCISYVDEERELTVRSIYVAIRQKCDMQFEVKSKDMVIFEGGYALLRCYVANATISWLKGMLPVTNDAHHRVLLNGALLIKNARGKDTGTYRCVAEHVKSRCQISHSISVEIGISLEDMCGKAKHSQDLSESDRGKIVGGEEAVKGSHPWIALIIGDIPRARGKPSKVFCGGSLVNNYWVVTAAHCMRSIKKSEDSSYLKIKLGKHDRTNTEKDERSFTIERIVMHPHFDEETFDNDVALLKLSDRVFYSHAILPICLPPPNFMQQFHPFEQTGAAGFVAGWGQMKESGLQPAELRAVELPLIDFTTCKRSTSATMTVNMFCAGYKLSTGDACKGDSGGPFEMSYKGKAYLAGVVSWGEGCARPAKYGFYTKVEHFLDFILNHIN